MASASRKATSLNNSKNNNVAILIGRLKSELPLKLILVATLNPLVYLPYIYLQQHHFFPVTGMPSSFFDRLIPFSDLAVWPYLSIYLLTPIGPLLMGQRNQILRYAAGIVLISLIADTIFLFWPTSSPQPAMSGTNYAYQALRAIDNSFHALPSLHAAFAVYSALCAGLVLRELRHGVILRWGIWVWALMILYATLATKQHVLVDIIAGSVLGFGAYTAMFSRQISISKSKLSLQPVALNLNKTQ
jgi:membrane-associated phospholipid phosphatase